MSAKQSILDRGLDDLTMVLFGNGTKQFVVSVEVTPDGQTLVEYSVWSTPTNHVISTKNVLTAAEVYDNL